MANLAGKEFLHQPLFLFLQFFLFLFQQLNFLVAGGKDCGDADLFGKRRDCYYSSFGLGLTS